MILVDQTMSTMKSEKTLNDKLRMVTRILKCRKPR